ncbi:hypothetical protein ES705_42111 [subsurface metagenome]
MKNISIDISGKIDSSYISAIKEIKKATDSQKISFFHNWCIRKGYNNGIFL